MLLNLPNPPGCNVYRGYAGGFGVVGVATETLIPIYLLYATSALKKSGCEYDILDSQAMGYDSSQVVNIVGGNKPDVLISWISLPSIYHDLAVLNEIKKAMPDTLIVALGAVCNVMPEETLLKSDVDLVIRGAYPHYNLVSNLVDVLKNYPANPATFDKIGGAVYVRDGEVVQNPIEPCDEDLDHLTFDVYSQVSIDRYLADIPGAGGKTYKCIPILTSMGCPFSCVYCPYPVGYGRKIIHKSVMRIVDEIEFLKTNFGIGGFLFRDQLFTHDKQRVIDFCDEIIRRNLEIGWLVEARIDQVSEELLLKMRKAGCFRIHYGVETGAPEMLKKTGKPGIGVNIEAIKEAFRMTEKAGIATRAHMIVGLPGESPETLKYSYDLLRRINPNSVTISILTPYPGTKLYEMAREEGLISTFDWSKYTGNDAIMSTGGLDVDQVSRAAKQIERKFHYFKLLHDSSYRRSYVKQLTKVIAARLFSFFKLPLRVFRR